MKTAEFDKWLSEFASRFPERWHWLTTGKADEDWQATLKTWRDTLDDQAFEDCLLALKELHRGDIEHPKLSDDIPAAIRKRAKVLSRERRSAASQPAEHPSRHKRTGGFNLGGVYRLLLRMIDAGASDVEQMAAIRDKFATTDALKELRYKCRACHETGFVSVWSLAVMQAIRDGESIPNSSRIEMVRCSGCERGAPRGKLKDDAPLGYKGPIERTVLFDAAVMLPVRGGDVWSEAAVGKIREFVAELIESRYAAKREPAFDAWGGE